MSIKTKSAPTETKAQREARERAEAQAEARNTRALQRNLTSQTRELWRRFGLLNAIGAAAPGAVGGGFASPSVPSVGGGASTPGGGGGGSVGSVDSGGNFTHSAR